MLLNELFDKSHPWEWTSKSNTKYIVEFPVHQGRIIAVEYTLTRKEHVT